METMSPWWMALALVACSDLGGGNGGGRSDTTTDSEARPADGDAAVDAAEVMPTMPALRVRWSFPDGRRCALEVETVAIEVYADAGTGKREIATRTDACDAAFNDARGDRQLGVEIIGLPPVDDGAVVVRALDAAGNERAAGQLPFSLAADEVRVVSVVLQPKP